MNGIRRIRIRKSGLMDRNVHGKSNIRHFGSLEKITNDKSKYEILKPLGRGRFGIVYLGLDCISGRLVALKSINDTKSPVAQNEIETLRAISTIGPDANVHFTSPLEIIEAKDEITLVFEFLTGGDLFDKIIDRGPISEIFLRPVVFSIVRSLKILHDSGIIHRDIKPENIMFRCQCKHCVLLTESCSGTHNNWSDFEPVLGDFGLSKLLGTADVIVPPAGTFGYASPEALNLEFTDASSDVWSLGVVLFASLAGELPFPSSTDGETTMTAHLQQAYKGPRFNAVVWDNVSNEAKDLIGSMLHYSKFGRITVDKLLLHPWFANTS